MAQKNPAKVAAKWSANLGAATQSITDGINAVTVSPTASAAAKKSTMLAKLTAAVNGGKWEKGLNRVSLTDWKTAAIQKGVQRIASGAQTAEPKMQAFMTQWLPVAQQISDQVKTMPNLTDEDAIARVRYAIAQAKAFGKSRS